MLAVPIEGDADTGDPMGAIALFGKDEGGTFGDEERTLLLLFAANASTSIRLQMAREGREREERLTTIGRLSQHQEERNQHGYFAATFLVISMCFERFLSR